MINLLIIIFVILCYGIIFTVLCYAGIIGSYLNKLEQSNLTVVVIQPNNICVGIPV